MRRSILLFLLTLVGSVPLKAQSGSNLRDHTFRITPSTAWTDTGFNLQPGDTVNITAVPASSDSHAKPCDPAGLGGGSSVSTASLPVPEAGPGALIAKLEGNASPILV